MPLGLDTLLPDPFAKLSDDELGYVEDRLASNALRKEEGPELLFQALLKRYGGDALRSAVEKRFNPRQPRNENGEWVSVGGVVSRDVELAHKMVGRELSGEPIGGRYALGKKIQRGEKLTRSERVTAKHHVRSELGRKGTDAISPVAYRRYRDFAKVHGMNLKTKTKSKHPGKQVGNPGANKPKVSTHKGPSAATGTKSTGDPRMDAENELDEINFKLSLIQQKQSSGTLTGKEFDIGAELHARKTVLERRIRKYSRQDVPINEPDPDMERQRAEERRAEAEA